MTGTETMFSRWISGLPSWAVLVLLVVPLAIVEPMKVVGLYELATKHVAWGIAFQVTGYALNILLVERIYRAGRAQLLRYSWFGLLDRVLRKAHAGVRLWLRRLVRR